MKAVHVATPANPDRACNWPTGNGPYRFECQAAPERGWAYCPAHRLMAYHRKSYSRWIMPIVGRR